MSVRHLMLVMWSCVWPAVAYGTNHILYECTDATGGKQFTNIPASPKGCKVLNISPVAPSAPPAPSAPAPSAAAPRPPQVSTPSSFPRVDRALQRERDNDRRRILENELGNEEKLLAQARKELAERESVRLGSESSDGRVLERLEPYQKRVRMHQENVANLRRELSKMR